MSPPDSALANLQQTIDDLERQLTGQRAERDEVLARETATAEPLPIINSGNRMRRRELFGVVAGTVILLPVASLAQHLHRVSHVGVLMGFSENRPETQEYVAAFAKALEGYGWVEGKNLRIDYRFFSGNGSNYLRQECSRVGRDVARGNSGKHHAGASAHCTSRHAQYRSFSYK